MSAEPPKQQKLLLLTGIPGTGKTESGHVLVEHHGFAHLDAELHAMSKPVSSREEWEGLWNDFLRRVEHLKARGRDVVITWGFMPGVDDGTIRRLQEMGFTMVWFDGDRAAARREFLKRGTVPENLLNLQMSRIDSLDLEAFRPQPFNPFDEKGQFLPHKMIAEQLIDLS